MAFDHRLKNIVWQKPTPSGPERDRDVERLAAFLSSELGLDTDEIDVEQFPAGSSNLTYLVRVGRTPHPIARSVPPAVAGEDLECKSPRVSKGESLNASGTATTEYVLRRPPFGNTVKSAHDMHREFDVLSKAFEGLSTGTETADLCQGHIDHRLGILPDGTPRGFDHPGK